MFRPMCDEEGKILCRLDRLSGMTASSGDYSLSVLEPVDVPHCWQRYS